MTKQLTQEQIDSLNAIYAKMGDNSLELEVANGDYNNWTKSLDKSNSHLERVENVMGRGYMYRIKPQAPKKEYYKIEGAELPVPRDKNTNYSASTNIAICSVVCATVEDAKVWHDFFLNISDARNVILE